MSNDWGEDFVYEPGKTVPDDVVCVIVPGTTEEIPTDVFGCHRAMQDDDSDSRVRAEHRPNHGVEMIQENILSFLHFL